MDNNFEDRSSIESLIDYAQILWRWAWLLILVALIAGGAAYYISNLQPRVYQSSTRAVVNVSTGSEYYDAYAAAYGAQRLATTYAQTMITPSLLETVSERLGYKVTADITATPIVESPIFTVTVMDDDPNMAAEIANMVVLTFSEKIIADQSERYSELKLGLEDEISRIDTILTDINERLALLQIKETELAEAEARAAQMEKLG